MLSMKSRASHIALIAIAATLIGVVAGFYGCKAFHDANLAVLKSKYRVFYQTSPEQMHSTWAMLHHADSRYDKAKGRDSKVTDEIWRDQQKFLEELKAAAGSHSLYYVTTKELPSTSGYLVVSFFGKAVKEVDFTTISQTQ
jgi:hypothetical protein